MTRAGLPEHAPFLVPLFHRNVIDRRDSLRRIGWSRRGGAMAAPGAVPLTPTDAGVRRAKRWLARQRRFSKWAPKHYGGPDAARCLFSSHAGWTVGPRSRGL